MKIAHKIVMANAFDILLIALTAFFAYQNLNLVLAKLHFVEIADDLNASFLEARLSEKNYFLYGDRSAIEGIRKNLDEAQQMVNAEKESIVRATGEQNLLQLNLSLHAYLEALGNPEEKELDQPGMQTRVREAGQGLREFSSKVTRLERSNMNKIIADSKKGLATSFFLILLSAIGVSQFVFHRILKSLKRIERTAHTISEGNFGKVEEVISADELGSVTKAINSMSQELMNREELIMQSKKLASMGILTAGVAHELGNPLNNISMLAQVYQELYDDLGREERIEYMKRVDEEADRIKEIVKDLLDFSKPKEVKLKQADINAVVQKSLKLVRNIICICNVEVKTDLQDRLPTLLIDEYQIQEVLINLLTNAVHAVSPGDVVEIRTRLSENRDHVEIEVRDTGKGIPPEYLDNVFDPFFTTKGASGTGLGLFVSYGIVRNHQGTLRVNSEVGTGTCFIMELPVPH
jgi:signal transduction histidine kinase